MSPRSIDSGSTPVMTMARVMEDQAEEKEIGIYLEHTVNTMGLT